MKLPFKLLTAAASMCLGAGVAHAQGAVPSAPVGQPPADTGPANPATSARDTSELDIMRDRDEAITREDRARRNAKPRALPAKPEQVVVGSEVRDIKGLVIGKVDSVSMSAAVVVSPLGKVEVPLEAFGVDTKGLLIGIPKSDFDAAVAAAVQPAK